MSFPILFTSNTIDPVTPLKLYTPDQLLYVRGDVLTLVLAVQRKCLLDFPDQSSYNKRRLG